MESAATTPSLLPAPPHVPVAPTTGTPPDAAAARSWRQRFMSDVVGSLQTMVTTATLIGVVLVVLAVWLGPLLTSASLRGPSMGSDNGLAALEATGSVLGYVSVPDPDDGENYRIALPYCHHVGTPAVARILDSGTQDDSIRAERAGHAVGRYLARLRAHCVSPYRADGKPETAHDRLPALWQVAAKHAAGSTAPPSGKEEEDEAILDRYVSAARALGVDGLEQLKPAVRHLFVHPISAKDLPLDDAERMLPFALADDAALQFVRVAVYDEPKGGGGGGGRFVVRALDLNVLRFVVLARWKHSVDVALGRLGAALTVAPCMCPAHLGILGSGLFFWHGRPVGAAKVGRSSAADWYVYAQTAWARHETAIAPRLSTATAALHPLPWGLDERLYKSDTKTEGGGGPAMQRVETTLLNDVDLTDLLGDDQDMYTLASGAFANDDERLTRGDAFAYVARLDADQVDDLVRVLMTRPLQAAAATVVPLPVNGVRLHDLARPVELRPARVDAIGTDLTSCFEHCYRLERWLLENKTTTATTKTG